MATCNPEEAEMRFLDVCAVDDFGATNKLAVRAAGQNMALFKVGSEIYALENACAHSGAALAGGQLCERIITCPAHG
jgi:nitrite reductase/ring-hydroxylating ferredoxin subunit